VTVDRANRVAVTTSATKFPIRTDFQRARREQTHAAVVEHADPNR
jgi:hypothetical protein